MLLSDIWCTGKPGPGIHKLASLWYPHSMKSDLLPVSRDDMDARGWDLCDYIVVTGDAYIDHPSFGTAVISRLLGSLGRRVGVITQPRWDRPDDFMVLGRPRLAFLVTAGALDSMVAHYTAALKPRHEDVYSPGGRPGMRPDRAVITYTGRIRQAFSNVPVIAGGIEASLRRLSHYDYWSDRLRRSVILDAKLDLVIYGMGEQAAAAVDRVLNDESMDFSSCTIPGTVFACSSRAYTPYTGYDDIILPAWEEVSARDPSGNIPKPEGQLQFARSVQIRLLHENPMKPSRLLEAYGDRLVVQNPPAVPLDSKAMDRIYALPFARKAHPMYRPLGDVPALQEVRFSITSSRGCYGSCSFCALRSHQGRIVQSRNRESILAEAKRIIEDPEFKGHIHDVGGPTANFLHPACSRQLIADMGPCENKECLFPRVCRNAGDDHMEFLVLLRDIRKLPGVKRVFVRSGIRYDYLMAAPESVRTRFLLEFCAHHVSGQLKVAPEHTSPKVLDIMGKPPIEIFDAFAQAFALASRRAGKTQYIIPYFMSGHPGARLDDAVDLACYLRKRGFIPDQVQDFYPTPGTAASCMYYTGMDPRPGRDNAPIHIPKGREKRLQRALLHAHKKENRSLVLEALRRTGRMDLAGTLLRSQRP